MLPSLPDSGRRGAAGDGTGPWLDAIPFCGAVITLKLSVRFHRRFDPERQDVLVRAGTDCCSCSYDWLLALLRKAAAQ